MIGLVSVKHKFLTGKEITFNAFFKARSIKEFFAKHEAVEQYLIDNFESRINLYSTLKDYEIFKDVKSFKDINSTIDYLANEYMKNGRYQPSPNIHMLTVSFNDSMFGRKIPKIGGKYQVLIKS